MNENKLFGKFVVLGFTQISWKNEPTTNDLRLWLS
jgi:hypothetical protein